jgi:hypothetical protein
VLHDQLGFANHIREDTCRLLGEEWCLLALPKVELEHLAGAPKLGRTLSRRWECASAARKALYAGRLALRLLCRRERGRHYAGQEKPELGKSRGSGVHRRGPQ